MVRKVNSWSQAAIYDPITGDVAHLKTLIGGDTLYTEESIDQTTTNGSYQSGVRYRAQFACSDQEALETLKGFLRNKTLVQAVAASQSLNGENLLWYERSPIKQLLIHPKSRRADGDNQFLVVLEFEGLPVAAIGQYVNVVYGAFQTVHRELLSYTYSQGFGIGAELIGFDYPFFIEISFPIPNLQWAISMDVESLVVGFRGFHNEALLCQQLNSSLAVTSPVGGFKIQIKQSSDNAILGGVSFRTDSSTDHMHG